MQHIPLLIPHMPEAHQILPYLEQIDANRKYTNFGPLNSVLETRLAEDLAHLSGQQPLHVTTVSNCTVGIELALQALKLPLGARVLMPSITFVATATAVMRVGFTPVFSDVDPESWILTPEIAERALRNMQIDAVVPVSTFGCQQPAIGWDKFTEDHGVPVVIDAAGAYGNQGAGVTTDVVFSFHATKSFGAAEGGAVVSSVPSRIAEIRKLANFGIDTNIAMLTAIGTNAKMSEYHCAIALASFDMWEATKSKRQTLYARYFESVDRANTGVTFQRKPADGIYPLFPVLLPPGKLASAAAMEFSQNGIETRRWYCPPLYEHPALQGSLTVETIEIADALGQRIIGLPFFLSMNEAQIARITAALSRITRQA